MTVRTDSTVSSPLATICTLRGIAVLHGCEVFLNIRSRKVRCRQSGEDHPRLRCDGRWLFRSQSVDTQGNQDLVSVSGLERLSPSMGSAIERVLYHLRQRLQLLLNGRTQRWLCRWREMRNLLRSGREHRIGRREIPRESATCLWHGNGQRRMCSRFRRRSEISRIEMQCPVRHRRIRAYVRLRGRRGRLFDLFRFLLVLLGLLPGRVAS